MIDESGDGLTFNILAQWEKEAQMHNALSSEEFTILTGAISALSEKTIIRLDDKQVSNHISKLKSTLDGILITIEGEYKWKKNHLRDGR